MTTTATGKPGPAGTSSTAQQQNGETKERKARVRKPGTPISFQITDTAVADKLTKMATAEHRDPSNYASYILHKHVRDNGNTAS